MSGLVTKHIHTKQLFYFLPKEKSRLIFLSIYTLIMALTPISFKAYFFLTILFFFYVIFVIFLSLLPAYKQAKFLSEGNYYKIFDDVLESQSGKSKKPFSFKGKCIKYVQNRDGVMDIVIGGSMQDFIKFFGSREKIKITICGVINGDEVMEYLNKRDQTILESE